MANYSTLTRKEQVLERLRDAGGEWVNGTELANEEVGGSEGLKRLRELRDDDLYPIEARRHPDPGRDIWQYRLQAGEPVPVAAPRPPDPPAATIFRCPDCGEAMTIKKPPLWGYMTGKCRHHGLKVIKVGVASRP